MMTKIWKCGLGLVVLAAMFGACDDDALDADKAARKAPGKALDNNNNGNGNDKVLVCHETGNGKIVPLELPAPADSAPATSTTSATTSSPRASIRSISAVRPSRSPPTTSRLVH